MGARAATPTRNRRRPEPGCRGRSSRRQRVLMQAAGFGSSDSNPIKKPDSCQSIAREGEHRLARRRVVDLQNSLDFNRLTVASGRFVAPLLEPTDTRTLEVWIRVTDHLTESRDAGR